ncbi:12261_t:CDS:2, partial [Racocetra persica]
QFKFERSTARSKRLSAMSVLKDTATVNEEDANLLVLIIDTNPLVWKKSGFPLKEALRHLLVFINAHLALKHDNDVAIIASHIGVSKFLYPIPTHENSDKTIFPNMYQKFRVIDERVIANMSALFEDVDTPNNYPDKGISEPLSYETSIASSMIAGALSMALC